MRWPFPDPRAAWRALAGRIDRAVSGWVRRRQGADQLPVRLGSRRLYILPTGVGITLAIVCLAMLLGSMNYNNSMGFALTFLIAATGLVAMHRCHQNLAGLQILSASAEPVFAGDAARFELRLHNDGRSERFELEASAGQSTSEPADIAATSDGRLTIEVPTRQRGTLVVPRFGLRTRFPLALLNTWTWLYVDARCTVWPRPAASAPRRPESADADRGARGRQGDEDFAGLRDYRAGDSPRLIAWKTLARTDELKSRKLSGQSISTTWIDFDACPDGDLERRLSILARWVVDAEANGERYGLRVPGMTVAPDQGIAHQRRCLDALAAVPPVAERRHA